MWPYFSWNLKRFTWKISKTPKMLVRSNWAFFNVLNLINNKSCLTQFNIFSLHTKSSRISWKDFLGFQNLMKIVFCLMLIVKILIIHKSSLQGMWGPNLGSIGSAVLTFIGYKHTGKQTDQQAKFIYRYALCRCRHYYIFFHTIIFYIN